MNIFKVLANGDGRVNEANISAFLGYLLDPNADHGLRFEFLKRFLDLQAITDFYPEKYEYKVLFEQAFRDKGDKQRKNIVDIVLLCFDDQKGNKKESYVKNILTSQLSLKYIFLIENKVRDSTIQKDQLKNQFGATKDEFQELSNFKTSMIYSIYVTPQHEKFFNHFNAFENTQKTHILWKSEDDNESIYQLLKDILKEEANGDIESLNNYTRQTINSFIHFIDTGFKSEKEEEKERKYDGTYTQKYINLNIKTKIAEKLENLKKNLIDKTGLSLEIDLSSQRFPRLVLPCDNYNIHIFTNEARDKIKFNYKVNPNNYENSIIILDNIAAHLETNGMVKNRSSTKDAYYLTREMSTLIKIDHFDKIYNQLIQVIEQAKIISP